jgi:hypothetical protein
MGCDLELTASRLITINKTGKTESQSYCILSISMGLLTAESIVNDNNPYDKYCEYIKQGNTLEPIYIWDDKRFCNMPEIIEREEQCILYGPKPEDIISYKNTYDDHIEWLDECIKQALDNNYELEWWISY